MYHSSMKDNKIENNMLKKNWYKPTFKILSLNNTEGGPGSYETTVTGGTTVS